MVKFLGALVGLIGIFWLGLAGGAAVAWWDRRPPHTPNIHVLFFNYAPADSLKAQRDNAIADKTQAEANVAVMQRAIDEQNAAIERLSAASTAAKARSARAVAAGNVAMSRALAAERRIASAGEGSTPCERAQSVDDAFKETLQ